MKWLLTFALLICCARAYGLDPRVVERCSVVCETRDHFDLIVYPFLTMMHEKTRGEYIGYNDGLLDSPIGPCVTFVFQKALIEHKQKLAAAFRESTHCGSMTHDYINYVHGPSADLEELIICQWK